MLHPISEVLHCLRAEIKAKVVWQSHESDMALRKGGGACPCESAVLGE